MKSFNLELAKEGHPVCTRDGRKARVICWDKKYRIPNEFCVIALIDINGDEILACYTKEGRLDIEEETNSDLMMEVNKRDGWVNLYQRDRGKSPVMGRAIFATKEEALESVIQHKTDDRIVDTIHVEWEE